MERKRKEVRDDSCYIYIFNWYIFIPKYIDKKDYCVTLHPLGCLDESQSRCWSAQSTTINVDKWWNPIRAVGSVAAEDMSCDMLWLSIQSSSCCQRWTDSCSLNVLCLSAFDTNWVNQIISFLVCFFWCVSRQAWWCSMCFTTVCLVTFCSTWECLSTSTNSWTYIEVNSTICHTWTVEG